MAGKHAVASISLLIMGLLAGCADLGSANEPPPEQASIHDSLITGSRAGPIYLGMPMAQLRAEYGSPAGIQTVGLYMQADYGGPGVPNMIVGINGEQRVCSIFVYDGSFATQQGIKINQTQFDLRAALGAPDYIREHAQVYSNTDQWIWGYKSLGLEFSGRSNPSLIWGIQVGHC